MTEPYIYQTVHTLGGRAFRLAEHIALLDMAAHTLFARSFPLDASRLAARITPLLSAAKMPTDYSVFVQIRMSASGEVQIEIGDISLYKGYDLRSIRPDAISLTYELPFGGYPTSARQAI
ncbi:MAG: branched-chain amino acid aminotransferase, partial [Alistipes sp.]